MKNISFLLVLALHICISIDAYAKDKIVWYKTDQPPFYIVNGQGIHDQMVDYLIARMPEYDHSFERSSVKRALETIREKQPAIWLGLYKTAEREKFVAFHAIPCYLNLNTILVSKHANLQKITPFLSADGTLDLEKLLLSKQVSVGLTSGRMYSGVIDEMINKYKDTGVFYERAAANMTTGFMEMLMNDRLDAYFEVPTSVKPAAQALGIKEEELALIPIAGMKPYEPVYAGMPYSEWGSALIQKIDAIMRQEDTITTFAGYYEKYLDSSMIAQYEQTYRAYYQEQHGIHFQPVSQGE